jgi:hypothetical protein
MGASLICNFSLQMLQGNGVCAKAGEAAESEQAQEAPMFHHLLDAYLTVFAPAPRRPPVLPEEARPETLPPLPIGRRRSRPSRRPMVIGRP